MKVVIDDLEVVFPFETVYSEQLELMHNVKKALDAKGHAVIECPTGTGKTISLLAVIVAYQKSHPDSTAKFIYCTRTVPEMTKCVEELKLLLEARQDLQPTMALCLSSRKNMCINPKVLESPLGVDAACRNITAPWVRQRVELDAPFEEEEEDCAVMDSSNLSRCSFFEDFMQGGTTSEASEVKKTKMAANALNVPPGVYTLEDMQELGKRLNWCPYFMARHCIELSDIVVYNFQYLLDPRVSKLVSASLTRDCIVVMDESHNVDDVCIESLSVNFSRASIDTCLDRLGSLSRRVEKVKRSNVAALTKEYEALVAGLQGDPVEMSSVLTEEVKAQAVPGAIRNAQHFIQLLTQLVVYIKQRMEDSTQVSVETTSQLMFAMETKLAIDSRSLKFVHTRLESLLKTLEVVNLEFYTTVSQVCDFFTLVSTYREGFSVIIEPYDTREKEFRHPVLQLACLDASIAIKPTFTRFNSVILISGTLSPLDFYPRLLDFEPKVSISLPMSISRNLILPLIVTRGSDQSPVTSQFSYRDDPNTNRNFGQLLISVAATVPDGVVGFFTSYDLLEQTIAEWDGNGILAKVLEHKLIFVETKDVMETSLSLDAFRRACDCGRGAVFLSVARGKVSEGIDFAHHYGRAVILFGIPYQYTKR
jgi:DNA excision repair protein ERCC-2